MRAMVGGVRWWVLFLIFSVTVINHIDRQVLSILKPIVSSDLGWSEMDYANIVFSFQAAYALGFVCWGVMMDRGAAKRGILFCVGFWSVAACAHAFARSAFVFGLCRFFLGFGESGNLPAGFKIVCKWFPVEKRALAIGVFNGGANVGAMIAPFLISWLTVSYGWAMTFAMTGGLGFVWLVVWWFFYDDSKAPVLESRQDLGGVLVSGAGKVSYARLLCWRTTWVSVIVGGLSVPIAFFYMFWIPDFLTKTHGIDLVALGPPLLIIYLAASAGSIVGGFVSSAFIQRGMKAVPARKCAMLICLLCILPVALAPRMASPWSASLLIGLAGAAHQGWVTNLWTIIADMIPHRAVASVFGLGGLVGACGGMAMAKVVGYVLETTGSYVVLFLSIPCVYAVSLLALHMLLPKIPERL